MLLTKSLFCVWSQLIGNVNSTKSGGEALDLLPTISPWLNNNRLAIFTSLIIAVHHLKCFVIGLLVNTCNKLIGGARVAVNFFSAASSLSHKKTIRKYGQAHCLYSYMYVGRYNFLKKHQLMGLIMCTS